MTLGGLMKKLLLVLCLVLTTVLLLPGVEDSKGVAAEIAIAKRMGLPILAVAPE